MFTGKKINGKIIYTVTDSTETNSNKYFHFSSAGSGRGFLGKWHVHTSGMLGADME